MLGSCMEDLAGSSGERPCLCSASASSLVCPLSVLPPWVYVLDTVSLRSSCGELPCNCVLRVYFMGVQLHLIRQGQKQV